MLFSKKVSSKTSLLIVLGIISTTTVSTLIPSPAMAGSKSYRIGQSYPRYSQFNISAGTRIPVRYEKAEKILVTRGEKTDVTLEVAQDIRSTNGRVIIPEGSEIKGELRPTNNGTRFVAEELILRNSDEPVQINATSRVVSRTQTITRRSDPDILRGAAIGATAGAVLGEIFGNIDFSEVLGGAGVGVLGEYLLRGNKEVEVAVVYPERDLDLTLRDNLVLSGY